jgi:hypothetical protein
LNARIAIALTALAAAGGATAQDRPAEEELFGTPPPAAPAPAPPRTGPPEAAAGRDDAILGGAPTGAPGGLISAAQENPLAIGGQAYLRADVTWSRFTPPSRWPLQSPNLVDVYLDSRPNERVRAFALVRTRWNPLAVGSDPVFGVPYDLREPRAVLDQLWVNFDVGRRVFVTAGRQHVKWGVGRFWNPTDFLHPVRRDPLAVFDDRAGATMVKVHVPWEARGWNLYGVALLDDPAGGSDAANELGKVAGGARAEVVIGAAELGADVLVRDGQRPRFGFDFSAGIWDLDVQGEVALRTSSDVRLWEKTNPGAPSYLERYGERARDGVIPQAVLGVSYAVNYSDEDAVRFGAEYFYNGAGYDDPSIYPWLQLDTSAASSLGVTLPGSLGTKTNDFRAFYVGRQYAGAYALLAKPGSWNDHTFTLSVIANASDGSGILRLDHAVQVNTYLTVESYLAANVGKEGGEFRFSLDVPLAELGLGTAGRIRTQPPVLSGGVALRVKL